MGFPGRADGGVVATHDGGDSSTGGTAVVVGPGMLGPGDDGSSGVKTTGNGVTLDPGNVGARHNSLIWISNSLDGTISKVDTRAMKELARYRTCGTSNCDPSRTSVALDGDIVVANRAGDGATKIASTVERCVDANHDGRIETSSGPTDVLPWGQDECVLWHVDFPTGSLARAAAFDAQMGADGEDSSTVWIGLYNAMQMVQLDSRTGKQLAAVNVSPVHPYGAAVDKDGNVFVRGDGMVKINPSHNVTYIPESPCAYGITVDVQGTVWETGANCIARYNPATGKWQQADVVGTGFTRGIALDGKGSAWVADTDFGVHQVDVATMKVIKHIPLPALNTIVGVAVDWDGKVWAVGKGSSNAARIDPATYAVAMMPTGNGPYTYSDMTGVQLRNAAAPFGRWRRTFQACNGNAEWKTLAWTADLPPGTSLTMRGRAAADVASLAAAPWQMLASTPPDAAPVLLVPKMGAGRHALFELEVQLKSVSPDVTPLLKSVTLTMDCDPTIG